MVVPKINSKGHKVKLPGTDKVIEIRPIPRDFYIGEMIRAVDAQQIEIDLLCAALLEPRKLMELSTDQLEFLKKKINEISGFDVFQIY